MTEPSAKIDLANPETWPAVKPLEWTPGDGVSRSRSCWQADGVVGRYTVTEQQWWGPKPSNHAEVCDSDDEAKAAAQADYEARIYSAFVAPAPDPPD